MKIKIDIGDESKKGIRTVEIKRGGTIQYFGGVLRIISLRPFGLVLSRNNENWYSFTRKEFVKRLFLERQGGEKN